MIDQGKSLTISARSRQVQSIFAEDPPLMAAFRDGLDICFSCEGCRSRSYLPSFPVNHDQALHRLTSKANLLSQTGEKLAKNRTTMSKSKREPARSKTPGSLLLRQNAGPSKFLELLLHYRLSCLHSLSLKLSTCYIQLLDGSKQIRLESLYRKDIDHVLCQCHSQRQTHSNTHSATQPCKHGVIARIDDQIKDTSYRSYSSSSSPCPPSTSSLSPDCSPGFWKLAAEAENAANNFPFSCAPAALALESFDGSLSPAMDRQS
jgi:hypothetical protein